MGTSQRNEAQSVRSERKVLGDEVPSICIFPPNSGTLYMKNHYDVIIVGAGPAGTSCALALKESGLSVALIDKETFPRNKTCGDAIPGPALKYLKTVLPNVYEDFRLVSDKSKVTTSTIYTANGNALTSSWVLEAYNSKRSSFDTFLLDEVKRKTSTKVFEGVKIKSIRRGEESIHIENIDGTLELSASMVIGCDGANSVVSKHLATDPSKPYNSVSVRAYYKNVKLAHDTNEFFFFKKQVGYLWIFQVNEEEYNVGYGIYQDPKKKSTQSLKAQFEQLIEDSPILQERLKNAERVSPILGFNLPLGGVRFPISGNRFLLCGDAARLIDPFSGHGIDKAVQSGILAGEQIIQNFKQNAFDERANQPYDNRVYKAFLPDLRQNLLLLKYARLANLLLDLVIPIYNVNPTFFKNVFYRRKKK